MTAAEILRAFVLPPIGALIAAMISTFGLFLFFLVCQWLTRCNRHLLYGIIFIREF